MHGATASRIPNIELKCVCVPGSLKHDIPIIWTIAKRNHTLIFIDAEEFGHANCSEPPVALHVEPVCPCVHVLRESRIKYHSSDSARPSCAVKYGSIYARKIVLIC
jgi:hypothetical protein